MTDDDAEILAQAVAGFSDEAQEMLQQFEDAMLVLESDPSDAESLNAAFRAAHTIKGHGRPVRLHPRRAVHPRGRDPARSAALG